jgi:hypothetical protein
MGMGKWSMGKGCELNRNKEQLAIGKECCGQPNANYAKIFSMMYAHRQS